MSNPSQPAGSHPDDERDDLQALDEGIQRALGAQLRRGDQLDAWVLLGAVRADDGGRVVAVVSDPAMPVYLLRGVLAEADAILGGDE